MNLPDNNKISVDGKTMRELADKLKEQMPGYGFALLVYDFNSGDKIGNYISNVGDDFMIQALECQLDALKKKKTFVTPESRD